MNRDKNKLSMASALIWKEEVVTEENLGNIKSQDSLHATGPDTRGENSASLTGVRVGAGVQETGSYSLSCAALPGTILSTEPLVDVGESFALINPSPCV